MVDFLMFVVLPIMWLGCGWKLCESRHQQRGIAVDKFFDRPDPLGGLGLTPPAHDWDGEFERMLASK